MSQILDGKEPEADAIHLAAVVESLRACKDPQKRYAADVIERLISVLSDVTTAHERTKIELDAMCENHNAVFKCLKDLRALLRRIYAWDMMDGAADGPYWRKEIDTVLAGDEAGVPK